MNSVVLFMVVGHINGWFSLPISWPGQKRLAQSVGRICDFMLVFGLMFQVFH